MSSGDSEGSRAYTFTSEEAFFRARPIPVKVPPVPTPATKASGKLSLPKAATISLPVVSS